MTAATLAPSAPLTAAQAVRRVAFEFSDYLSTDDCKRFLLKVHAYAQTMPPEDAIARSLEEHPKWPVFVRDMALLAEVSVILQETT